MDAFKASSNSSASLHEWDLCLRLESINALFKPILDKFERDLKACIGHLLTVHNETCGCHIECASEMNKAWNQKKVPFMELHKLSGLPFEDFLGRILRLSLANPIQSIEPLTESEFWLSLRQATTPFGAATAAAAAAAATGAIDVSGAPDGQSQLVHAGSANANGAGNGPLKPPSAAVAAAAAATTATIDDEELADIQSFILSDIVDEDNDCCIPQAYDVQPKQPPCGPEDFAEELARLKRKEKHMAPVDCTGVPAAFGLTWFCKWCERAHNAREDCSRYRPLHQPRFEVPNGGGGGGDSSLPPEFCLRADGVYYGGGGILRAHTRLGPLVGETRPESKMDFDEDRSGVWLIHCENGERKCVVADNWVGRVTPAEEADKANVLAISIKNELYLVTIADLPTNTKLLYFAKEDPTTEFWTCWTQAWANQTRCTRCSVHGQFDTIADYRVHIALWHDLSFQGNPQNRIYYCPDCNAKRIGAKDIAAHCRSAHGAGALPFRCRHCSKRFETYNSLIKHKTRIHAKEKPLKKTCDQCGKVYLDPKALKQHVRQVHERAEQLHCGQCEMILSSKYALNRHVKEVHQKQQEHICPHCKKHFTQHSNLKQHLLIHLGVKPFLCQHQGCKSAFTTKQCLQVHYRKVHRYSDETMPPIKRQHQDSLKLFGGFKTNRRSSSNKTNGSSSSSSSSSIVIMDEEDSAHNSSNSSSGFDSPPAEQKRDGSALQQVCCPTASPTTYNMAPQQAAATVGMLQMLPRTQQDLSHYSHHQQQQHQQQQLHHCNGSIPQQNSYFTNMPGFHYQGKL